MWILNEWEALSDIGSTASRVGRFKVTVAVGPGLGKRRVAREPQVLDLFKCCVIDPEGCSNTGFTGTTKQLTQGSLCEPWGVSNAQPWREIVLFVGPHSRCYAGVAREDPSFGSIRVQSRFLAGNKGLYA